MSESWEFTAPCGNELPAVLAEKMTQARLLYAEMLDIIAELSHTHVVDDAGYPSLGSYVAQLLRITPQKATRMVAQAALVTETVTPVGYVAPAKLPNARRVLHEGLVDPEHVQAITDTLDQLPDWAGVEHRELVESTLADTARTHAPRTVREQGRMLLDRIDQDGPEPEDRPEPPPINSFRYARTADGGMTFHGRLDTEPAELLETILTTLAKPQSPTPGVADPRSAEQRYGDAVEEVVFLAARTSRLPAGGGTKPQVSVTIDYQWLVAAVGAAALDDGGSCLPVPALRRLACDADVLPVVLNGQSVPLDLGRKHRLVKPAQRRALVARDKGCCFPGCHLPARFADAHHLIHWADGGPTNLDNLALLCRRHHRLIHESEWSIHMIDRTPWFRPPRWVDPDQTLVRNVLHHPRT